MSSVTEENLSTTTGQLINLENCILPLVCLTVIIACSVNKFLSSSNSSTLYDNVKNLPFVFIKQIIYTYVFFLCAILVTFCSVMVLSSHQAGLIAEMRERPHHYFLWNYILLEIALKSIDKLGHFHHPYIHTFFFFVWCAMFAPSICVFDQITVLLAFQETFLIVCALTAVAFLWNLQIQKLLMLKLVNVFLATYILLTVVSVAVIVVGFPRNMFGLSLVIFVVHGGFLIHMFLFITCTHVFVELTRRGTEDVTRGAVDLFVCTMHLFGRIMIVNSYKFVALKVN